MKYFLLLSLIAGARAEEAKLYLQLGHSGHITSVAFSPDNRLVLTGSEDQTARLWDASSGDELRRFRGHSDTVASVAFSPGGGLVLTGSEDGTARLWDAKSGSEIHRFEGQSGGVTSVAFSPDGRFVLTGSRDKTARLWEVAGGERMVFQGHTEAVTSVAFRFDGSLVLTGSEDQTARLWDAASGREMRRFEGHAGGVISVALSPDGLFALTGSTDKTARLWDAGSGAELRQFRGHTKQLTAVTFSPDGRQVLSASLDDARLWDAASGAEIRQFRGPVSTSVAFSSDGGKVLIGTWEDAVLRNAANGDWLLWFRGYSDGVNAVACSPDGRFLLSGSLDSNARLWDVVVGTEVRTFAARLDGLTGVASVAFSPDGRRVLTGELEHGAKLWNTDTGAGMREFAAPPEGMLSVKFSPDGRFVLTGGSGSLAVLWDASSGALIRRFTGHSRWIVSVAFSPDGRFVLTGSEDRTARLWDAATGAEIRRFVGHTDRLQSVAYSPDGRFVLTGSDDFTTRLWDAATGTEIRRFGGHTNGVTSVAFSPDGRFVLAGSRDGIGLMWDATSGAEIRRFSGECSSVAFSPDGRFVISGSREGTVRVWQAATGKWLATLVSFRDGGWAVADPEGRYDASDPDNAPGLHFVADNDVIELRQLKRRFYTPGLLAKIWREERLDPVTADLKDVKLVPGIEVILPAKDSTQATVRLTNRSGGLGQILLKVNGREIPVATRGSAAYKSEDASAELKLDLSAATLSPTGNNVIEVSAFNGENSIESRGLVTRWAQKPPEDSNPPRIFAIVVGVSQYANERMNLRYSAKDAVDMGNALRLAAMGLYNDASRVNIAVLASGTAREPTKESIRAAFDAVAQQSRAQDLLIVYFAGHGQAARTERDQYYYFTKEARSTDVEADSALRTATTVSSSELRDWLYRQNMPLKQVVVLDTCAAGAAFSDVVKLADRRDLSPDQIRAIQFLKDSTGSWILMGSAADAVSYEANRYAQGLVTYALLQGMQGAALDGDQVEVARLFGFAQRQVEDLAHGIGGIQRPILSAPKGQTFPIGILVAKDRAQIHVATLKPELLRARVHDEDDLDPLKLEPALRMELRSASLPVARGAAQSEPSVVYLDQVVDEVPDALIPVLRYKVAGDGVKIRLRLLRNGKPVSERNLELSGVDPAMLSKRLVAGVVADSGKVK